MPNQKRLPSEEEKKQAWKRADKIIENTKNLGNGKYNSYGGKFDSQKYKKWSWKGHIDAYEFDNLTNEELDIIVYEYFGDVGFYLRDKANGEYKRDRKGTFKGM